MTLLGASDGSSSRIAGPKAGFREICQVYMKPTPVAYAGLALALLCLNVLTFGALMTAYLLSRGMRLETVGIWRGVSSASGLLGTLVYTTALGSSPFILIGGVVASFADDTDPDRPTTYALPSPEEAFELASIIEEHYPALDSHFCVCDGLKLPIAVSGDLMEQSRYYNGWTSGHYVTNLFGFAPDGMVIFTVLNAAGSFHDSSLAGMWGVYRKLETMFLATGLKCIMDSAFSAGEHDFIVKSSQDTSFFATSSTPEEAQIHLAATSMRQSAEWGMRALQGSMPRLTDTFPYEDSLSERCELLEICTYLYNLRCKYVGLNQLRNTFVPNWSRDALDLLN